MLNIKPFRQSISLCGPASLKMVLGYFGVEKTEAEIARLAGGSKQHGTGAEGLLAAAEQLGFRARYKDFSTLDDVRAYVKEKKIPVIVDWFSVEGERADGHYSVAVDITAKDIVLQDPELGAIRRMSCRDFEHLWFDFSGDVIQTKEDIILRRMIVVEPK